MLNNELVSNKHLDHWYVNTCHTQDAFEQAVSINDWLVSYDQLSSGKFSGIAIDAHFKGVQIFREIFNKSVYQNGTCKTGTMAFGIPLFSEGISGFWGHQAYSDDVLCLKGGEELDFRSAPKVDMIGITVELDEFLAYGNNLGFNDIERKINGNHILRAPQSLYALRLSMNAFTRILEKTPEILAHESIQDTLKETVFQALINFIHSINEEDCSKATTSYIGRRKVVEKAKGYILSHSDRPIMIEELCKVSAVSQRTLQNCFEDVLNTNPVQYLRTMRLNGLRKTLKSSPSGTTSVQQAAAEWGFWHLSRLAKEYKELFQELPSETLKQQSMITT